MPRLFFCREVCFRAGHHYAVPGWDDARNRGLFGEAVDPHEHDWRLTLWFEGPLDSQTGTIADLGLIDQVLKREVLDRFHGRHINEVDAVFATRQPTTEVLAAYFAERLTPLFPEVTLARVRLAESVDIFAEWEA